MFDDFFACHRPAFYPLETMRQIKRLAATACPVILLAGCGGQHTINPTATAKSIVGLVVHHTGFRPVDLRCPSGIPATVGGRFNCHFTGPEGPYTAYVRIAKVHGPSALFNVKTQPSSWDPPTLP